MTDGKQAMQLALDALETAHTGLKWYRDSHPEDVDGSDDEADDEIETAIAALRSAIQQQDGDALDGRKPFKVTDEERDAVKEIGSPE